MSEIRPDGKVICPCCGGRGIKREMTMSSPPRPIVCDACDGTGLVKPVRQSSMKEILEESLR